MDVIKYFFEEPVYLETLSPDLDPDARRWEAPAPPIDPEAPAFFPLTPYYRGYLAGTDLETLRIGLTAIQRPEAFVRPLLDAFGADWAVAREDGTVRAVADAADVLRAPEGVLALAAGPEEIEPALLVEAGAPDRRAALPALIRVLERADVVILPEPAHHGHDLSLFSARPLRDRLVAALRRHPVEGVRRLVLPYVRARSEERFYFEQWQEELPDYVEEV